MKIYLMFSLILIFTIGMQAQTLQTPESAVFDADSYRYFISNFGDGNIIQIDSTGEKSFFQQGLAKSLGMVISNHTLFVVTNQKMVCGFDLATAAMVFTIQIDAAVFLNDITCDNSGYLYVTDSNAGAIYKIDIANRTVVKFLETESKSPNGIIYDKFNHRLVVCYFQPNAPVDAISLPDAVRTNLSTPGLDNLDGIAQDEFGNFYISSWGAGNFSSGFEKIGTIYKFDNQFLNKPAVVLTGYHGPADIFYAEKKHELLIPLFFENEVKFETVKGMLTN